MPAFFQGKGEAEHKHEAVHVGNAFLNRQVANICGAANNHKHDSQRHNNGQPAENSAKYVVNARDKRRNFDQNEPKVIILIVVVIVSKFRVSLAYNGAWHMAIKE